MERHTIDAIEQIGRGQYEQRFLLTDGLTKDGLVDQESVGADAPAMPKPTVTLATRWKRFVIRMLCCL